MGTVGQANLKRYTQTLYNAAAVLHQAADERRICLTPAEQDTLIDAGRILTKLADDDNGRPV